MTAYSYRTEGFTDQGAYTPDNLHSGEFPSIQRTETITGAVTLHRGAVLGRITANGFYTLSDAAAVDGSEKPVAILAEDIDVTAGDADAVVYHAGEFNITALLFGSGHSAATFEESLKTLGPDSIFLRKNQEA